MQKQNDSNSGALAPVVNYMVGGQQYTYQSPVYSSLDSYKVGQAVTVNYDPNKPDDADIDSFGVGKLLAIIFIIIGSIFVLISILIRFIGFTVARRRF